jgi:myb proto-oncogene protein
LDFLNFARMDSNQALTGKQRSRYGTAWTVAQDQALTRAVEELDCKSWREVAKHVPGSFTHVQCAQRWNKVLKPGLVKGWWSPEEDERLLRAVREEDVIPTNNWTAVAKRVPGRTAKQCRERWSLCLDPAIKRDHWTPEEDERLMQLHSIYGNNWTAIAKEMEGRTALAVKCHVHSLERCRRRAWTQAEDAVLLQAKKQGLHWSATTKDLPNRSKYAIRVRWSALDGITAIVVDTPSSSTTSAHVASAPSLQHPNNDDEDEEEASWDDFSDAVAWERCLPLPVTTAPSSSSSSGPSASTTTTLSHPTPSTTASNTTVKPAPHSSPNCLTENHEGGFGGASDSGSSRNQEFTTPETKTRTLTPMQEPKKMTASIFNNNKPFTFKRMRGDVITAIGDKSSLFNNNKFARFDSAPAGRGGDTTTSAAFLSQLETAASSSSSLMKGYCDYSSLLEEDSNFLALPTPLALLAASSTTASSLLSLHESATATPPSAHVIPIMAEDNAMMDIGFLADLLGDVTQQ